ncbi:hypothetical protein EJB05_36785, partial [Eragrostis curvula]
MHRSGRAVARFLVLLLGLVSCLHVVTARPDPPALRQHRRPDGAAWSSFEHLQDAPRGSSVQGLAELKSYLARFGYMQPSPEHDDDAFDEHMESAVKRFQSKLSLPVTGQLDSATLARIMSPRCGVGDMSVSVSASKSAAAKFAFLNGEPRWTLPDKLALTYAISPTATVAYLPREAVRAAFRSAFARWARVIPVDFVEIDYYGVADIKVGFYDGEHGDGSPFDGPLGVLAHAGGPIHGGLHLDAAEAWTVDLDAEKPFSEVFDLESVATHEIGHVLGLNHSSSYEAVMYPYISPRERKLRLSDDDIEAVQLLYGSNPSFRHSISMAPGRTSCLAGLISLVCVVFAVLVTQF